MDVLEFGIKAFVADDGLLGDREIFSTEAILGMLPFQSPLGERDVPHCQCHITSLLVERKFRQVHRAVKLHLCSGRIRKDNKHENYSPMQYNIIYLVDSNVLHFN